MLLRCLFVVQILVGWTAWAGEPPCPSTVLAQVLFEQRATKRHFIEKEWVRLFKNDLAFAHYASFRLRRPLGTHERLGDLLNVQLAEFRALSDSKRAVILAEAQKARLPKTVLLRGLGKNHPGITPPDIPGALFHRFYVSTQSVGQAHYLGSVLSLRSGDTVKFSDGTTFVLGEFLGAGNATHIFGLATDPHLAIRIPFASKDLSSEMAEYAIGFGSAKRNFPPQINRISILHPKKIHPGTIPEYYLVPRITNTEDGLSFLKRLLRSEAPQDSHAIVSRYLEGRNLGLPPGIDHASHVRLLKLLADAKVLTEYYKKNFPDLYQNETPFMLRNLMRQFLWEGEDGLNSWILVDWD